MSESFVKSMRNPDLYDLIENHAQAFLLLTYFAHRSRWCDSRSTGLKRGQCFTGRKDYKRVQGMTPQSYRTVMKFLTEKGYITKQSTNRGTIVTLSDLSVYDVMTNGNDQPINQPSTNHQPTTNQPSTTNVEGIERVEGIEEKIYEAYPRRVGKPKAVKAILKALKKIDPETLMERTQKFARAVNGKEAQFIPHPSTWYNQERFNDDPSTWSNDSKQSQTYNILG